MSAFRTGSWPVTLFRDWGEGPPAIIDPQAFDPGDGLWGTRQTAPDPDTGETTTAEIDYLDNLLVSEPSVVMDAEQLTLETVSHIRSRVPGEALVTSTQLDPSITGPPDPGRAYIRRINTSAYMSDLWSQPSLSPWFPSDIAIVESGPPLLWVNASGGFGLFTWSPTDGWSSQKYDVGSGLTLIGYIAGFNSLLAWRPGVPSHLYRLELSSDHADIVDDTDVMEIPDNGSSYSWDWAPQSGEVGDAEDVLFLAQNPVDGLNYISKIELQYGEASIFSSLDLSWRLWEQPDLPNTILIDKVVGDNPRNLLSIDILDVGGTRQWWRLGDLVWPGSEPPSDLPDIVPNLRISHRDDTGILGPRLARTTTSRQQSIRVGRNTYW